MGSDHQTDLHLSKITQVNISCKILLQVFFLSENKIQNNIALCEKMRLPVLLMSVLQIYLLMIPNTFELDFETKAECFGECVSLYI